MIRKVADRHYKVQQVDATVMAEAPKLKSYIPEMKILLSRILGISTDEIGIKATTMEGLGYIGRKEGISAQAVATLRRVQ